MRTQDWEHRLTVLSAWQKWKLGEVSKRDGATYRAVLDGCAVTVRSLLGLLGVTCQFRTTKIRAHSDRLLALASCCADREGRMQHLSNEDRTAVLEVLYLGNRAVAHPEGGDLDHRAGEPEMTATIRVLLRWLKAERINLPELAQVPAHLFEF